MTDWPAMNSTILITVFFIVLPCFTYGQLQRAECTKNRHCRRENEFCVVESETCMQYATEENGYACEITEQCQKIKGVSCNSDTGICTCADEHFVIVNDECVRGIDADCKKLEPCEVLNSVCNDNNKCECKQSFKSSLDSTYCGLACEDSTSCPEGAECSKDVCRCAPQLVTHYSDPNNSSSMVCLSYASKDNDYYCQVDEQCKETDDKPECEKNTCTCGRKTFYDGKCGAGLHKSCGLGPLHDACVLPNTECTDGKCVCTKETRESEDHTTCINLSCIKHEDCQYEHGMCVEGQCTCQSGYVLHEDKFQCLPYASANNNYACEIDGQCDIIKDGLRGHATCSSETGECSCEGKDDVIYKDECVLGIGGSCKVALVVTLDCPIQYTSCSNSICECDENLEPSKHNNACGLKCVGDAPEHASCVDDIWQCDDGYASVFEDSDRMLCMPHATESNGYACEYTEQCETIEEGEHWQNGNLTCVHNRCVCASDGFTIEDNKCVRGIDAYCFLPLIQCTMKNTMCNIIELKEPGILDGRCGCKWGYGANKDNSACEPWAWRMNLTCPEHAYRNENKDCVCAEGYVMIEHLLRDECVPLASAEDDFSCEHQQQCSHIIDTSSGSPQQVQCPVLSHTCTCIQDTWAPAQVDGEVKCVPGIGSECSDDSGCGVPNSYCGEDSQCVCNEGLITIPGIHGCAPNSTQENDYACAYDEQCAHIPDSSASYLGIGIMDKSATCNKERGQCNCKDPNFLIYMENGSPTCEQGLYGSCSMDLSCRSVKNSKCAADKDGNKVCQCQENHVLPPYEMTCIPLGTPDNDFACDQDLQCSHIADEYDTPGATAQCDQETKTCTCRGSDWFLYGPNEAGQMICARELDATCSRNEDCYNYIPNSNCEEQHCVCKGGYSDDGSHKSCNSASGVGMSVMTLLTTYLMTKLVS